MRLLLIVFMTIIMMTLVLFGVTRTYHSPNPDGPTVTFTTAPEPSTEHQTKSPSSVIPQEDISLSGIYLSYGGGMERGFTLAVFEDDDADEPGQTTACLLMEADFVSGYDPNSDSEDFWYLDFKDQPLTGKTIDDLRLLDKKFDLHNLPDTVQKSPLPDDLFMTDGTMEYSLTLSFSDGSWVEKDADHELYEQLLEVLLSWAKEAAPSDEN